MNLRHAVSCGFVCAALVLTGCEKGREAPGRVNVQVVNAASGMEGVVFRREQDTRGQTNLAFKGATVAVYDADTYDFYATDIADIRRTFTFAETLETDTTYAFVLTEVAGEIKPVVITYPKTTANPQVISLNAASGMPAMDLYVEPAGVGIVGAAPRGTFGPQEQIPAFAVPTGTYELWLTAAGNPSSVLLTSPAVALDANTVSTFVVVAENGQGTVPLSIVLLQGSPVVLLDQHATSELRVINGANDQGARDVAIDSQFTPPLFSATTFGEPTPYAQVPTASMKVNITPVGDQGVLEAEASYTGTIGQRATMLFNGPAGTLVPLIVGDDGRRLTAQGKIRFMSAISTPTTSLDFVVTFPDQDPNTVAGLTNLFAPGISAYTALEPGDYDLYLRQSFTANYYAGPIRLSLAAGGLYAVLAVDGPDTATANVRLLDDFP
jgi:hypothetical protein